MNRKVFLIVYGMSTVTLFSECTRKSVKKHGMSERITEE